MIRLAGGLMVIGAATLFGFRAADALEEEYRQIQDIRRIMHMLQGEIRYARSFLSEAFLLIADTQQEPYASWLTCLQEKMDLRTEGSFPDIWEETAREHLGGLALKEEEKKRLYDLGQYLGTADVKMQISHLQMYVEHLEGRMEEMQRTMQTQKKVAGSASALLGFFSSISGSLVAPIVGIGGGTTAVPTALVIALAEIIALCIFLVVTKKYIKKTAEN